MKIKVGVFFGGKSVEHEISVITMSQAIASLNPDKYEIVPIYISKQGVMYTGEDLLDLYSFKNMDVLLKRCYKVCVVNDGKGVKVMRCPAPFIGRRVLNTIDVAFPIVHGTNVEDGTLAGFLNLLDIPYVGPDIMASSIGMDKILMKKVLRESGLPVVDYVSFFSMEYIKNETELVEAIEFAMEFSDRIIVENAVENLKEINCSVIGNIDTSETSVCEEPFFSDEILSYADKYMGGSKSGKGIKCGAKGIAGAKVSGKGMAVSDKKLPADITDEKRDEIQKLTKETFKVLGCSGVARVDFLMDTKTDKVYVNEINTIPGALSYYLWEATGKTFEQELDELIDIALKRHREREKLTFSYDQNILAMQGGTKGTKGMKGTKVVKK